MKRISAFIICLIIIFSTVKVCFGEEKSGWFGENATYHYDFNTGILKIEGTGEATHNPDYETGKGFSDAEYSKYISNSWRVKEVVVGEGITKLDSHIFWFFRDLEKITLPSTLEEIGYDAFYNCISLKEITLPDSLKVIGGSAFAGSGITKINIPEGVTEIGYRAFENAPLEKVHLPSTLEKIDYMAFCSNTNTLKEITVEEKNKNFASVDGVLYSKDMTKLICYPSGKEEKAFSVLDSVKIIGEYSFENSLLTEINMAEGVEIIEHGAFDYSTCLEVINLPNSIKKIGSFDGTEQLKKIIIPKNVTELRPVGGKGIVDIIHMGTLIDDYYCYCGKFHHHPEDFNWSNIYDSIKCTKMIDECDEWAEAEIEKAKEEGLVPERFNYGMKSRITRAEFAELIVALVEKLTGDEISLPEKGFDDSQSVAVSKAKEAGIVTGTGDGMYSPGVFVKREEIAVMMHRALQFVSSKMGEIVLEEISLIDKKYVDVEKVSPWAVKSLATLNKAGIVKGTTANTLFPDGTATVQECIIMVYRIYNNFLKSP